MRYHWTCVTVLVCHDKNERKKKRKNDPKFVRTKKFHFRLIRKVYTFFFAFLQTALFLTRSRGEWGNKKFVAEKRRGYSTSSDWKSSMNFSESKETSFVLFLYLRSTENSLIKLILFFFYFFFVHLMLHERLWVCMKVCLL